MKTAHKATRSTTRKTAVNTAATMRVESGPVRDSLATPGISGSWPMIAPTSAASLIAQAV